MKESAEKLFDSMSEQEELYVCSSIVALYHFVEDSSPSYPTTDDAIAQAYALPQPLFSTVIKTLCDAHLLNRTSVDGGYLYSLPTDNDEEVKGFSALVAERVAVLEQTAYPPSN